MPDTRFPPEPGPEAIPVLDAAAARRKLAGMADPAGPAAAGSGEKAAVKEHASLLCLILAQLFNRDALAVETLWERIGTGLAAGCAKVRDDDLDAFVSLCLEHVKAEPAKAAAHDGLKNLLASFAVWTPEMKRALLRYLEQHKYPVLVHGRDRWESYKELNPRKGRPT